MLRRAHQSRLPRPALSATHAQGPILRPAQQHLPPHTERPPVFPAPRVQGQQLHARDVALQDAEPVRGADAKLLAHVRRGTRCRPPAKWQAGCVRSAQRGCTGPSRVRCAAHTLLSSARTGARCTPRATRCAAGGRHRCPGVGPPRPRHTAGRGQVAKKNAQPVREGIASGRPSRRGRGGGQPLNHWVDDEQGAAQEERHDHQGGRHAVCGERCHPLTVGGRWHAVIWVSFSCVTYVVALVHLFFWQGRQKKKPIWDGRRGQRLCLLYN